MQTCREIPARLTHAMHTVLDEFSVAYIALTEWVPPLFTVLVGGLLASLLFPRWQDSYARNKAREERKLALAEELSRNMTRYVTHWNRLRTIAELEVSRAGAGLSEEEFARKKGFVEARNSARDAVIDTLCSIEIYFSKEVRTIIDDFMRWDEACMSLGIDELPTREKYALQRRKVLSAVHEEVSQ